MKTCFNFLLTVLFLISCQASKETSKEKLISVNQRKSTSGVRVNVKPYWYKGDHVSDSIYFYEQLLPPRLEHADSRYYLKSNKLESYCEFAKNPIYDKFSKEAKVSYCLSDDLQYVESIYVYHPINNLTYYDYEGESFLLRYKSMEAQKSSILSSGLSGLCELVGHNIISSKFTNIDSVCFEGVGDIGNGILVNTDTLSYIHQQFLDNGSYPFIGYPVELLLEALSWKPKLMKRFTIDGSDVYHVKVSSQYSLFIKAEKKGDENVVTQVNLVDNSSQRVRIFNYLRHYNIDSLAYIPVIGTYY